MDKKIVISVNELSQLLKNDIELSALECGGVDNWSYYGEHKDLYMELYPEYEDWDEMLEQKTSPETILSEYPEYKDKDK